jgi:hypothetical protein
MGISLRARHYWSNRQNKEFFALAGDGRLNAISGISNTFDRNFNTFNVDMNYIWQFAPGSELTATWKDASSASEDQVLRGYNKNFSHIFNSPQNNSLSLKILYYVDYLQLRKKNRTF